MSTPNLVAIATPGPTVLMALRRRQYESDDKTQQPRQKSFLDRS